MKIKSIVAVSVLIMIIGVGAISQASPVFAISSGDTKAEISYVQQIDNIKVGETAKIKATVKNTGTTTFDSNLGARLYVDGHYICSKSLDGLKPGQERTVELEYTPTEAGSYKYNIKVKEKVGDTMVTFTKSNAYYFVAEYSDTEAEISYVQQINNIKVGETAKIKATVKNTGTTTFDSDVGARLYVDGHYICSKSLDGLKPGQERTVELEYTPTEAGSYKYNIKVKEKVGDTMVTFTKSNAYYFVAEYSDTKAEISYVQQINNIKVGETAKIKATVKNTGTTTFDSDVGARLYVDGHYICSKSLDGLKPGQERTVELEYTPTEAGSYKYNIKVKEKVGDTMVTFTKSNAYYFVAEYGDTPTPTPTENEGEISTEAGGLNIMIKYPKRVLVGETNNIIVELTTKDFEDPGYPDLENNIFDGVIKIASDESMNSGDINLFMCPNKLGDLGPKPINWPNKPQYYKYEDLIDSQVGEIDMQIFEIAMRLLSVVPIANFPFGMYDVLHWDPSSIAEATKEKYTEGQAPTDICFYDENNYDCWEHSWNFNYYASNVVSENGVKLVFPFYFEEPGTKRVSTYTEVNYELSSCFGIVGCKKLGKTYDFKIEVLSE